MASCNFGGPGPTPQASSRTLTGSLDGAPYLIEVPGSWNGVLLLYSHGGGALVQNPPAEDAFDPATASYLMARGYALAGSGFRSSGWFVEDALKDDLALLSEFRRVVDKPRRTMAWGPSLGAMVTIGLAEGGSDAIDGALPMCGVVADSVPFWNQNLDAAFAFKILFAGGDPTIAVTGSDPSHAAGERARTLLEAASTNPLGRARTALVAALREIPVNALFGVAGPGGTPLAPPPGANAEDLRATALASIVADALSDYFLNHLALEIRAGGNPSSNIGVDYARVVAASPDYAKVQGLYASAGASIDFDLARLNQASRIRSDPAAMDYVARFLTFTGTPHVPVLTLHTVADQSTPAQLEVEYRRRVRAAGHPEMLRQLFVNRGAHCNFTTAEIGVALTVLLDRITTGRWGAADDLTALNALSAKYDSRYWEPIRVHVVGGPPSRSYPSFVTYSSIGLLRKAAA